MEAINITGGKAILLSLAVVILLLVVLALGLYAVMLREQLQAKVDPWQMQETVMRMSGQQVPQNGPCITNGSLMYAGLMAEELAETYRALIVQLRAFYEDADAKIWEEIQQVIVQFDYTAVTLEETRRWLKKILPQIDVYVPLTHEQAKDIFDGACDVPVVACGFALASGLPGAEGYRDTCGSNISKANPDTGVIDKEPDGKWIKGRNYRKPDLVAVLDSHYSGLIDHGLMPMRDY